MVNPENEIYDIAIIGAGINGAGIARDAAGRGYKVCLIEKGDPGQATSSASTKLIHGGLRYLEHYAFRLVGEALAERDRLLSAAPHIIWPLRFVLPHHKGLRPQWLIRLGLFIYDHLGGTSRLAKSRKLNFARTGLSGFLKSEFVTGFVYSDCWVEDSRLVILNVMDAQARGADIRIRTTCSQARVKGGVWALDLKDDHSDSTIQARMVVNAGGPWALDVDQRVGKSDNLSSLRLIKGSHLILKRKMPTQDAFLIQNTDGRITFMIPYEQEFTLLGTTDVDVNDDPGQLAISEDEIEYLIEMANLYLAQPISRDDIAASYAGVRPLYDDGKGDAAKANRDYHLKQTIQDGLPLLSIYGGKLTTYRKLAEAALKEINTALGENRPAWTADAVLPGGDFGAKTAEELADALCAQISDMPYKVALRLVRAYGTSVSEVTSGASDMADLGLDFGAGLTEAEARYLAAHEFARRPDDVLYRRSKLYLHLDDTQIQSFRRWWNQHISTSSQPSG